MADNLLQALQPYCNIIATYHAFLRHQNQDFTGFVDGTENPVLEERITATVIPDGEWAGGSFVV